MEINGKKYTLLEAAAAGGEIWRQYHKWAFHNMTMNHKRCICKEIKDE